MAKMGTIPVVGPFVPEMQQTIVEAIFVAKAALLPQRKEWVTFLIDSNGGYVDMLNGIRAAMLESGLKFRGSVQSKARSAGFMLLQYCNWRAALSNSELLFHYGGAGLWNDELSSIVEDHEYVIRYHKQRLEQMVKDLQNRTGLARETLHDLAKYQRDILAEKALEMNLIDEIVNSVPKSEKPTN
jgi:ATP-dependent protease ClpP protease subunit